MTADSTDPSQSDAKIPVSLDFATAAECGVEDHPVPEQKESIKSYGFLKSIPSRRPPSLVVGRCTQEMSSRQREINPEERQAVFDILKSFNSLAKFSDETDKLLSIRSIVRGILGETRVVKGPFEYPEPLQRNAAIILDRLDTEIAAEQELEKSDSPNEEVRPRKRRRQSRSQMPASDIPRLVSIEDPTFKHVMRGILIGGESRRRFRLDKDCCPAPRNHKVFGDNGLKVGDWWPQRICALRDGAHGAMQGGIAGSLTTGAFSIVVSNDYAELDKDQGDILYYSGSNSHENTNPNTPQLSNATKAMRVSHAHGRPLRVLRSSAADGKYAPSKGLRYDGLYMIESEAQEKNEKGGAYIRFKLVRCAGQKDIDASRPNAKEREIYEWLKEGRTW